MSINYTVRFLFFLILAQLCVPLPGLKAQVGGQNVYEFLDLPASARLTGLGDHILTVSDDDVALAYDNPAVLTDSVKGQFSFSHKFYLDAIDHGYFSYGMYLPKWELAAHVGIQYIGYGEFISADIFGNQTGTFTANETALVLGAAHAFGERLSIGLNTKWIQSRFESYNSLGFSSDIGLLYSMPDKQLNIAFVLKNIGTQLTTYENRKEPLPFDVQMGLSKRLKHLPFRLSVVAHHLHRWNVLYDDPNEENTTLFTGEEPQESKIGLLTDNLFRHLIISGEFLIGKKEAFRVRVAYNHLRKKELSVDNYLGLAGFSMGLGIKIKRFTLDYGYSIYHLAGGSSHIGLTMNINQIMNRL